MVIWSDPAKADLRHIFEYIAHDSHHYAKKVTQEIVAKTGVIIYEIIGPNIYIMAVAHKRRELKQVASAAQ